MRNHPLLIGIGVLIVLQSSAFGAGTIGLELFAGPSFKIKSTGLPADWGDGWAAGMGLGYDLAYNTRLSGEVSVHRFPFIRYDRDYYNRDYLDYHGQPPWGPPEVASAEPIYLCETALAMRFVDTEWLIETAFSLRLGVDFMHIGEIILGYDIDNQPNRVEGTNEWKTKPFMSFGVGFAYPVRSNIDLTLEARIARTLDETQWMIPALLGFRFKL